MIKLSGSVNRLSPDELAAERARYDEMQWAFPDGLTHKVRIQIPLDQIDQLYAALKQLRQDRKGIYNSGRDGGEPTITPSVSIYLNGAEMTGSWMRLWGRVGSQPASSYQPARQAPAPAQQRTAQSAMATAAAPPAPQATAAQQPPQIWQQAPSAPGFDQEDIPF